MKIKIEYEWVDGSWPYYASTHVNDMLITAVGSSWAEARERLLTKVEGVRYRPILPDSEEVEI